jgi:hypothetical protein
MARLKPRPFKALCFFVGSGYGENGREDGFPFPSWAFAALRGWEILEAMTTQVAIHGGFKLGPIPEATASFANFQKYAQFHD